MQTLDPAPWDAYLADIARRYHVPGIVAGVVRVDPNCGRQQRVVTSTGVTSRSTGIATDRDTVCQIGSITKLITATMVLQLCEEGLLSLETPVIDVLPEFHVDSPHTSTVTVRNLLTHTSGIDGDVFVDMGRGEDSIARFVDAMSAVESLFTPNTGWSYCNSGFIVAGRIVEVLDGGSWNDSVCSRINRPLGLETFYTLPEEALGRRYQVGHVRAPGQLTWDPVPIPDMHRGRSPAGVILSDVDDLLNFGAAFLRQGDTGNGEQLLSAETVATMLEPAWDLHPAPAAVTAPQWGLGWMLNRWSGHRVVGHGGTKLGNKAWFEVLPDDGLAMVVFCNGGIVPTAGDEICAAFAETYAGITPPRSTSPAASGHAELDDAWLGTYSDAGTTLKVSRTETGTYQVSIDQSRIRARQDVSSAEKPAAAPSPTTLLPTGESLRFVTRPDTLSPYTSVAFADVDGQRCAYVGIRCLPQRDEETP